MNRQQWLERAAIFTSVRYEDNEARESYQDYRLKALKVEKTWGYEKIHFNTPLYCMKELIIIKGQSTSIHFHEIKEESLMCVKGKVRVYIYNKDFNNYIDLDASDFQNAIQIKPGIVHRIEALEDCIIVEASTFSKDSDSIRIAI